MSKFTWKQLLALAACGAALLLVYLSQRWSYASVVGLDAINYPNVAFSFNRTVRLLLNDGICLVVFRIVFTDRPVYRHWAWKLLLLEVLIVLPLYLILKLSLEGPSEISSPLLSTIHRLIVNPLLMMILLAACYLQELKTKPRA